MLLCSSDVRSVDADPDPYDEKHLFTKFDKLFNFHNIPVDDFRKRFRRAADGDIVPGDGERRC